MMAQSASVLYSHGESSFSKLRHSQLPAVFAVVASSVAYGASTNNVNHKSFLNPNEVTSSQALTSGMAFDGQMTSVSEPKVAVGGPVWVEESISRIEKLGALPDGWGGEGYVAAEDATAYDAERLLSKLIHAGLKLKPAIGLDDDGAFSFHIASGDLIADLSVHSDGTYSYFAEFSGREVFSDESPIDGTVDLDLMEILKA